MLTLRAMGLTTFSLTTTATDDLPWITNSPWTRRMKQTPGLRLITHEKCSFLVRTGIDVTKTKTFMHFWTQDGRKGDSYVSGLDVSVKKIEL